MKCQIEGCEKDITDIKEQKYITSQNITVCNRHADIFTFIATDWQSKLDLWKKGKLN